MPLDLIDAPLERTAGVMSPDDVIALHTVRVRDAIVIEDEVRGRRRELPAQTALAKVIFRDGGQVTALWCDLAVFRGEPGSGFYDCLSDSQGSGKLDFLWRAVASEQLLGFGEHDIRPIGRLATPVGYRVATPEERPTGKVGYAWCAGGLNSLPRFEISGEMMGRYFDVPESHPCALGEWTDGTHAAVRVGRLIISVAVDAGPKSLAFKVEGEASPGPLAHLDAGGDIRTLAADQSEREADLAAMAEGAFAPAGPPVRAAAGEIAVGADLFVVPVRYALTGVLKDDVYEGAWGFFGRAPSARQPSMKAGQVVYAQRLAAGALPPQTMWCAPRKSDSGRWVDAVCFPADNEGHMWVESDQPMLAASTLVIPATERRYVSTPVIEREQTDDLPPMRLRYRVRSVDAEGLVIEVLLDWGDGAHLVRRLSQPWDDSGQADLRVAGSSITLRRGPNGVNVQAALGAH